MNHNMVWNLAGGGPKFEICLEMCSPGPKDTSKSPECHYSMPNFDFGNLCKTPPQLSTTEWAPKRKFLIESKLSVAVVNPVTSRVTFVS